MPDAPLRVLFACTLNSSRSPMAEALSRKMFGERLVAASAGLRAAEMDGFVLCVLAEMGIDMTRHSPRTLDEVDLAQFILAVALSPEAHGRVLELTRELRVAVEYWPTEDVACLDGARDHKLAAYRQLRDCMMDRLKRRFG